ncbi:CYTH domain-containing protein [Thiohalorhabdus denitrificans]|uniref:CYTH domain-containing protein n=1 Tax=Thiohalorhabdus denitrificans TaxID=381306 RepID=A0A1G5HB42_9GAMM|nr:CYTH domain-containing protein [Thiohalorhabdus denitrificans]SCY60198.1 CYTH domain-containing protein [Thiohalorhabdus denitrificans]
MVEQEYKLQMTQPDQFEAVASAPEIREAATGPERTVRMVADYIDTPDLRLLKGGYAYRIRKEGEEWVATVKADMGEGAGDGLHHHREWEAKVPAPEPDLEVFSDPVLVETLRSLQSGQPLTTLFRVDMVRRIRDLNLEGGTLVEWAADQGRILAGEREAPICEVELELKEGSLGAIEELVSTLLSRYPLQPGAETKFARGLALAGLDREGNA